MDCPGRLAGRPDQMQMLRKRAEEVMQNASIHRLDFRLDRLEEGSFVSYSPFRDNWGRLSFQSTETNSCHWHTAWRGFGD